MVLLVTLLLMLAVYKFMFTILMCIFTVQHTANHLHFAMSVFQSCSKTFFLHF